MNKLITRVLLIISVVLINSVVYSAFEDIGWTARSKALGNSLFADFDGINSMNYNPASISLLRGLQAYVDWGSPYMGLNDGSFIHNINVNIAVPFWNKFTIPIDGFFTKRGAIGLSVHRVSVMTEDADGVSTELYHEAVYSFFYAKDLNDFISRGANISAGVKLSLYDIGVGEFQDVESNPDIGGSRTRLGFGLDAGITYDFSETIKIGGVYKNLIAPNVSILDDGKDSLASEIRLGMNWDMGDLFFLKKSKLGGGAIIYNRGGLSGTNNQVLNDNRQAEMSYNAGFEFKQLTLADFLKASPFKGELLTVRLGGIYQSRTAPLESIITLTGGMGFMYVFARDHRVNLDYALEFGLNMGSLKQAVGLSYEYMLPNSAFAYKEEVKKEMEFDELINKKMESKNTNQIDTNKTVELETLKTNSISEEITNRLEWKETNLTMLKETNTTKITNKITPK